MYAERELVAPGADAVDDAVGRQQLDQRVDGREDGALEELFVVLVELRLAIDGLTFGGELFGRHVHERLHAPEPPDGEFLVEHLATKATRGGVRGEAIAPAARLRSGIVAKPQATAGNPSTIACVFATDRAESGIARAPVAVSTPRILA